MNWILYAKIFIAIFMIMGPFLIIPTFNTLTEGMSRVERYRISKKATIISAIILIISALVGEQVFTSLGISVNSFRIAGGILLLLMGISMLHAKKSAVKATEAELEEAKDKDDISVFPLATPLIAGPGAISTVILFSSTYRDFISILVNILSVIISSIIIYFLLKYSKIIYKSIGKTGANIITRIMGLILSAMAVEFIIIGIKSSFLLGN
jgi:multiple antibiotic resistance protein